MAVTLRPVDTVHGALAECYVTLDGNRYNLMQLTEFEATFNPNIIDVPILGRVQQGKKTAGGDGTWTATAYYTQSAFRRWMHNYIKTGVLAPFEIQITTMDPSTATGRQTTILRGCLIDQLVMAKIAVGDELLSEDMSGTFDDVEFPEYFTNLDGFQA